MVEQNFMVSLLHEAEIPLHLLKTRFTSLHYDNQCIVNAAPKSILASRLFHEDPVTNVTHPRQSKLGD